MVYKKHRISTATVALSLTLMFLIGFFVAYNVANVQYRLEKKNEVTAQAVQTTQPTGTQATATVAAGISTGSVKVVAISPEGNGLMGDAIVQIEPGNGDVLVNTNPFVEPDTQYSAVTAVDIAKDVTKADLSNENVLIDFNINGTVIGGPSAGAAMTVATISAIEHKPVKAYVAITGTIETDGTIGKVSGLIEKGNAAAANGYKTFLVPKGQGTYTYYQKQTTKRTVGGFVLTSTKMVPTTVNLDDYFKDKGMKVIEVGTIQDAISYML
jgi:uncharacterized protein